MKSTDRIEKSITLRATPARVWHALSNAEEFGRWFGFTFDGPFVEGRAMRGTFSQAFDEVSFAAYQKRVGVEPSGIKLPDKSAVFCTVERVEPERYFSFRWVPFGIDAEADPQHEPTTLVEFTLEEVAEGTKLSVVESGFDQVPAQRRARAFRMNEGGWAGQVENVKKYVESQ